MAATIKTGASASGSPGGNSSALNVTVAGVIKAAPGLLATIVPFASGLLTVNDCTTSGAVAAANQIYSVAVTAGVPVNFNMFPFFSGLYISALPGQLAIAFS